MGAWGYRPFENDSALDWLGEIERAVAVKIHERLTDRHPDAGIGVIAAAELLLECTSKGSRICIQYDAMNWYARRPRAPKRGKIRAVSESLFDIAIAKLADLWESSWPDEWDDPAESRKTIGSLRRALSRRKRYLNRRAAQRAARVKIIRRTVPGKRKKKVAA